MRRAGCRARSTAEGVGVVLLARVELQGQVVAEAVGHVLAGPARVHAPQFAAILEDRPIAVEADELVHRIPQLQNCFWTNTFIMRGILVRTHSQAFGFDPFEQTSIQSVGWTTAVLGRL